MPTRATDHGSITTPTFAKPEDIAGSTFWTFNLPLELRPKLEACLPDARFHFVTVKNPIASSTRRIHEAARSAILLFGDAEPPDLTEFLDRTGLPAFRLWTSFLRLHGSNHSLSGAVGFVLGRGGTVQQPDRGGWLRTHQPAPPDASALRDLYQRLGLSEGNFPNAPPAILAPPARPNDQRRYLVVPDVQPASAHDLVSQARDLRPGVAFTLLTQTEPGQPVTAQPPAGVQNLPGPYRPAVLEGFDGVVTNAHFAGFDALLRDLDVVCLGQPAWRAALPSESNAPAATTDAVFAAYFLAGTHYLLPNGQRSATPEEAFRAVAALLPGTSSRAPLPAPVPRAVPAPAASAPPPAPIPAPVRSRVVRAETIIQPPPPPALPAPLGDPAIGDLYRLPEWATGHRLVTRCPGRGRADGEILALSHDFSRSPLAAALMDAAGAFPAAGPARSVPQAALARFAEERPDVLHRMLVAELAQMSPGARIALVVGTDDPTVRTFARACATFGILRLHLPAAPWQTEGRAAEATQRRTAGLAGLVDLVGAWHPSHYRHAASIGYPTARLAHVSTFSPAGAGAGLLACVHDDAGDATALLQACRDAAIRRGCGLVVHISAGAVARLGQTFFTALLAEEAVRLEWEDAPTQPLHQLMAAAAAVISDTEALHDMARAAGRAAFAVLSGPMGDDILPPGAEADLATRLAALPPPAKATAQDDLALLVRFAIARSLPFGPMPSAAVRILQREALPIALMATTLTPEELQRAQRHVLPMLGVQDQIQVHGGVARLAHYREADFFAIWGTRHPQTSRELRWAARMLGRETLILEDGFIRSVNIGLTGEPGLSLILDDRAAYFDATRISRLEATLNDGPPPDAVALARCQAVIDRIVALKISKYNVSPYVRAQVGDPARPKILLLDQRRGDQSLTLGLADDQSFHGMVDAALGFAETHDILVKLHPDVTVGGREGCLGPGLMARLARAPGAYIIEQDVSPHTLIELAEKVFTVTSGAGFEALMAGLEVWCFGMPYYAGRGLTRDAVRPLRPRRARSVAEVFHTAWLTLSRYYSPTLGRACEIEDLIDHIVAVRPWTLPEGARMTLGRRLDAAQYVVPGLDVQR